MSGFYNSDDEELEAFKVTEGDLRDEFDPNRLVYRQTREDARYGIWADEEKSGYR